MDNGELLLHRPVGRNEQALLFFLLCFPAGRRLRIPHAQRNLHRVHGCGRRRFCHRQVAGIFHIHPDIRYGRRNMAEFLLRQVSQRDDVVRHPFGFLLRLFQGNGRDGLIIFLFLVFFIIIVPVGREVVLDCRKGLFVYLQADQQDQRDDDQDRDDQDGSLPVHQHRAQRHQQGPEQAAAHFVRRCFTEVNTQILVIALQDLNAFQVMRCIPVGKDHQEGQDDQDHAQRIPAGGVPAGPVDREEDHMDHKQPGQDVIEMPEQILQPIAEIAPDQAHPCIGHNRQGEQNHGKNAGPPPPLLFFDLLQPQLLCFPLRLGLAPGGAPGCLLCCISCLTCHFPPLLKRRY